jgi:hypothetical protein
MDLHNDIGRCYSKPVFSQVWSTESLHIKDKHRSSQSSNLMSKLEDFWQHNSGLIFLITEDNACIPQSAMVVHLVGLK